MVSYCQNYTKTFTQGLLAQHRQGNKNESKLIANKLLCSKQIPELKAKNYNQINN